MQQSPGLSTFLRAGTRLVSSQQSTTVSNLRDVLLTRLSDYHAQLGNLDFQSSPDSTQEQVQLATAQAALHIVCQVQQALSTGSSTENVIESTDRSPPIGTRDLSTLRTLIAIVFKWGVVPLLGIVVLAWPSKTITVPLPSSKIIDLTTTPSDFKQLTDISTSLLHLIFPGELNEPIFQTHITATLLNRHLPDLLRPCIALGWLPRPLATESITTVDALRPPVMRLLAILPPSQTIAALGSVSSGAPPAPLHVQKACASLLSRQLLRPEGVRGLCAAVFGEGEFSDNDAPLEKLEHVMRVLSTVPAGMKDVDYFELVIPRILAMLSNTAPSAYKRSAAFTISHMLASDGSFRYVAIASNILIPVLHGPFLRISNHMSGHDTSETSVVDDPSAAPLMVRHLSVSGSLATLMTLLLNTDPSPVLISTLLTPIIPSLYSLLAHLDRVKTSDPGLKEIVRSLLATWARVVTAREGTEVLWSILDVDTKESDWSVDLTGQIRRIPGSAKTASLSLFTPETLHQATASGELDVDTNIFDLQPDPVHFVTFLKSINRTDISSELFVKALENYSEIKKLRGADPLRTMLYLQVVIQMQTQMSEGDSSSNILNQPEHILAFIKHALESATSPPAHHNIKTNRRNTTELKFEDLRLVSDDGAVSDSGDSDDELTGSADIHPDYELTETALNLLLSILEANPDLSARAAPVLNDIFSLLEPLVNRVSDSIRPLAREARLVMTARLASTSGSPSSVTGAVGKEEDAQQVYQKALKLLQDPIIPVRAHGLLLLRELVSVKPHKSLVKQPPNLALVPAILSIFLQFIQDDDSYMFLNAVQGLASMVDSYGKKVLESLINVYMQGLDGISMTVLNQQDIDSRVRVGEALGKVIQRCGDALGKYADILVPPLFKVVRTNQLPTTLRTSALSLLASCEKANALVVVNYARDLSEAMIDLLEVESVRRKPSSSLADNDKTTPTMDNEPLSTNSKLPPLRRAALHFLSLLLRASIEKMYDSGYHIPVFSGNLEGRAKIVLAYVASTDEDSIVRVMARESLEELEQLRLAVIGL